jgi:alkylhydroperoxidase family enzyme
MTAMTDIEWAECLLEPRAWPELEKRYLRETGTRSGTLPFIEGCDWLGDAVIRFSLELNTRVFLEPDLADEVGLVVSQDNSCRYCFGAQRAFLRILGMKDARIARLEQHLLTSDFAPRDRVALEFARRVSRSSPLASRGDLEVLRKGGFSDAEVSELLGLIGLYLFFNRLSTMLALAPTHVEQVLDSWWARATRPLRAIKLRRIRKTAPRIDLTAEERTGPFSEVVVGLDGLPMARELRIVLDRMWSSNAITPRAVPLVFAVISRALGCAASEREATRLLVERGLTFEEVQEILTHLSSPVLDEIESEIVTLARETVWYQPAQIQVRCREFQALVTREQMLEFVGVASLANAVCRLGVVSHACE